jgi:PIN domain nuclease of toxin-antitoxin system
VNAPARPIDRVAELMADGCASCAAVAYKLRRPVAEVDRLWAKIRRDLGRQAR